MDVTVPFLLQRWKRLEAGMDQSAMTFEALSEHFKSSTKRWLKAERKAQSKRSEDCTVMDIYDTATKKGMAIDAYMCSTNRTGQFPQEHRSNRS
jgi:hypothetical protein